jgi:ATP-dependent RNA helicase SUPV3L1/SUV3
MMSLAVRMETRNTDKRLLYEFLCIPFDEEDPALLAEWKNMYHAECAGRHFDVEAILPELIDPESCTVAMLDRLEGDYRLCDLCYNYARRFLENADALLQTIQQRKDLISSGIIHVLSTQKLPGRKCRLCGKRLPWDWPYAVCDPCHRSRGGWAGA